MRRRSEFEAVLRRGCRIATRNFVLRACPGEASHARLGIIAGRKAAARAVDRNRGKRLIREAFRAASEHLGSYDITVQLRNDLRSEATSAVRSELRQLLESLARRCTASSALQPDRQ